jgi:hypothetical protein
LDPVLSLSLSEAVMRLAALLNHVFPAMMFASLHHHKPIAMGPNYQGLKVFHPFMLLILGIFSKQCSTG